jgi:hypothetical protein
MDINAIALLLMVSVIGFYTWRAFLHKDDPPPSQLPWVPIQVGKTKTYTSQTRDAGMYTERARRTAIISNPDGVYGYKGSTNGSLEWNFLTSVCVCPGRKKDVCPPAPNVVFSAGDADDEICDNIDAGGAFGGYDVLDFGGAGGNECDV